MFYQPDLFFYVLMLPVLGFIVIPGLWATFVILYRQMERYRLADVRGFVEVHPSEQDQNENMERRVEPRVRIEGPKAVVGSKMKCCRTHVANISRKGICLKSIPKKMYQEANDQFKLIFRSPEREYTMLVQTRWGKLENNCYLIGAEILNCPVGWESFVSGFGQPVAV